MSLDLGKQVGPLPLGAWLAVGVTVPAMALYARGRPPAENPPEPMDDISGTPGVGVGGSGQWVNVTPPTVTNTEPVIVDNESWAREAINWLISQGYDPNVSDSALRKYMAGEKMSAQEYTLIGVALRKLGSPPIPLPPAIFGPPTIPNVLRPRDPRRPVVIAHPKPVVVPTKPTVNPTVRYYTVVRGDTLYKIAVRYYKNGLLWPRIWNANRKAVPNPNRISVGQRLIIP